ncbi:hypothetical protein ACVINW_003720 [Bradyrhizobium sp. USDA 4461]
MTRYIVMGIFIVSMAGAAAQQAPDTAPAAPASPGANTQPEATPETTCPNDDSLCILAQSLKKKDPATGSHSGSSGGFIANQPPTVPGNRLDLQFLQKNEVKG